MAISVFFLVEKPGESRLFILQQSALIPTLQATHTNTHTTKLSTSKNSFSITDS